MPTDAREKWDDGGDKSPSHRYRDREIAALADRQHGVVATRQLLALGFGRKAIQHRATAGRLHRIHQGVYAVGHRKLSREGHWMAAVLAYGPEAVISHQTAAALHGIGQSSWKIDVTTPHHKRSRPGIRAHAARLHPEDISRRDGIPVTSVARTIFDLAAHADQDRLSRVIEDADRRELFDLRAIDRALARRPRASGARNLRAVLADYEGPADTRSPLERDFKALITNAGLPRPQYNVLVAGVLVDAYWPQWRLVVELDGRAYHTSPREFETDRIRDATLQKAGSRVLRVTRKRLDYEPAAVLADIRALSRRG